MPFRHCRVKTFRTNQVDGKNGLYANIFVNDSHSYRGEWSNDQRHGYGKLINHKNGSFYEGEFVRNRKHGQGRLTIRLQNGEMQRYYVGQWEDDQMNGYGTLYFSETKYYEGEFYRNQRCGWGRMHYDNGDVYEGDWFNNQRHGSGRLFTSRGDCYNGHWSEDKKHGYGQYYFKKQNRMCPGFWSDDFCKSSECTQLLNKEHKTSASEKNA